jgi:predicted DNA-binding transcriptional regulator
MVNLIEKFENSLDQTVKTFNSIFTKTPIMGYDLTEEVVICELNKDNKRKVLVGNDVLFLDLTQKEIYIMQEKKAIVKKSSKKLNKSTKLSRNLPSIYRILKPTEFLIYSAIKEVGEVDGVEELSRQIGISNKSIIANLHRLVSLGLIKKEYVACSGVSGSFNKLSLNLDANLILQ